MAGERGKRGSPTRAKAFRVGGLVLNAGCDTRIFRVTFDSLVFFLAQSHPSLHGEEKLLEGHLF